MRLLHGRFAHRWAKVDRHSRLEFAVYFAFAVAMVMFVALILSLLALRSQSRSSVDRTQQWLEISGDVTRTVSSLESFDRSESSVSLLVSSQDQLRTAVEAVDARLAGDWLPELRSLLPAIQNIASGGQVDDAVLFAASDLAQNLERFNSRIAADSQHSSRASSDALDSWFRWVVAVSILGALVLGTIVYRVLIPLNRSIRRSLSKLKHWTLASEREARRRKLSTQVADGLDASTSEDQAYVVIQRTMRQITPHSKSELLLADSSMAHLRSTVAHPDLGGPGCGVLSPWSCPAVRHGSTLAFENSDSIRSCPHLSRHSEPCSAVCSPLVFMGNPIGVIHTTGVAGEVPSRELVDDMSLVAGEVSARLGTLRAFARAEMQAATDVLTGLSNRRASEDRITKLVNGTGKGVVALIEVGGLIELNKAMGKETGDRAIRTFAEILRSTVRGTDLCGRWAGAQFVIVVDNMPASATTRRLESVRKEANEAFELGGLPGLSISFGLSDSTGVVDTASMLAVVDENLQAAKGEMVEV